ncbi:endo-1,4-beta-xylanase [Pedosphaera parvula]|uniref:Beta-xylanase n=1 Tax=Pedosphaera parvula (strain Ellin514) TaxID=320771 RepID=B9XH31_PEDPL|nr:endo-1,4-beta-xylanase [Pedosphaera parvula]EEF60952.1 Endo-1,4-beta-xylanase [Pedosphaera parvula Ellin514]
MKLNLFCLTSTVVLAVTSVGLAQPTLKDAFKDRFLVGVALNESQFTSSNGMEATLVKKQFNSITPENVLKWESIHPEPGRFNFDPADRFVTFGEHNHMFTIGHTLVWHHQTPDWVFRGPNGKPVDRATLLNCMSNHIQTVVGRYKGRVKGWDVVNEALDEDGTLRPSPWLKIIGPEFLVKAYQFAHDADPEAELYYNDYALENPAKCAGAVALVKQLQAAGIHLVAVGVQEHAHLDWPTAKQVSDTITAFSRLGVKVSITELDVDVLPAAGAGTGADVGLKVAQNPALNPYTNGLPKSVQQALARRYAELFAVYVKHHADMERVTFWGVADGGSWLNNWPVKGRTNYPLLFDREDKPKPAYASVLETARQIKTTRRSTVDESISLNQP